MKCVLVVEDNEDDAFFLRVACQRTGIPHTFHVVSGGDDALDYLSGNGGFSDRTKYPLPNLVFLDLKLPKHSGHEVLAWIRSQTVFKSLPVVMLTSSLEDSDVSRAYELGATSYLRKIASPAEFGQGVRVILKYWLQLNIGAP